MQPNNEIDKRIGANISRARIAAGLTQLELGQRLREPCAAQQISKYELGLNSATGARLVSMAEALQVSVLGLLEGTADLIPQVVPSSRGDVELVKNYRQLTPGVQTSIRNMVNAIVKDTANKLAVNHVE